MTTQATGDEQNPAAEQPRPAAEEPRPATIDALAKGLEVPVSAVRAAAAESTGLHYYDEARPGRRTPATRSGSS